MNCSTCKHSRFVKGRLQLCTLYRRDMVESAKCQDWVVTVVIPLTIFGQPIPKEGRV